MLSFTFSFDFSDLRRGVLTAFCILLATWIVSPSQPSYEDRQPISVEVMNELAAAQYVEHYRDKPVVILGSSITTMIPVPACRPQNVASIPLQGRSALTGLEVIRQIGARPDVVFVEVPQLVIGIDQTIIDAVLPPIYWRLQQVFPPLRYSRNWLVRLYQKRLWHLRAPFTHLVEFPRQTVGEWNRDHAAGFNEMFGGLGRHSTIDNTIAQLEGLVRELRARGTRVIFFDPVDPRIRNALPEQETRDVLRARFPDIPIIDTPDDIPIYRHDGLHMDWSSGLQFFYYLMAYAGIPYEPRCQLIGQPTSD